MDQQSFQNKFQCSIEMTNYVTTKCSSYQFFLVLFRRTSCLNICEAPMKFVWETLLVHNFSWKGPLLTKPVPIDSQNSGLSIGTGFVKNGFFCEKLWTNKVCETTFMGGSKRMIIVVHTLTFKNVDEIRDLPNQLFGWFCGSYK